MAWRVAKREIPNEIWKPLLLLPNKTENHYMHVLILIILYEDLRRNVVSICEGIMAAETRPVQIQKYIYLFELWD